MVGKLLFRSLSAVLATLCLVNLQPQGGVISWRDTLRAVDNDAKQGMAIWNGRRRFLWLGAESYHCAQRLFIGGKRHEPGRSRKG
jgi:hypothetical protein